MNIGEIFENAPNLEVKTIMTDSRIKCEAGIFFCIRGMVFDGHDFIDEAIRNGAVCVVHSRELSEYVKGITYIMVNDTLSALNNFTDVFYGQPTKNLKVYGIAGSDGKSTVALIVQCLSSHFTKTGYIGSKGIIKDNVNIEVGRRMVNAVYLQKMCREMKNEGSTAVVIEVDSRFIGARYIDNIRFDCLSFTNLNTSKMDLSESDEKYFSSKQRLFGMISKDQKAIINMDDEYGLRLARETAGKVITYGFNSRADYRAAGVKLLADHTEFILIHDGKRYEVKTNLIARFNIYNLVNALAILHEDGYPLEELVPLCRKVNIIEGCMQNILGPQPFNIIVDVGHTVDSFEKVFEYAATITPENRRIITVFGLPGGRETGRRAEYGKAADKECSLVILTERDSRMEKAEDIAAQIMEGISDANTVFVEDRYTAIRQAIELANPGDMVLILGKGNENYLDINGEKEYWIGDVNAVRNILHELYEEEEDAK
ncbi:MAG: UDP-N-acetylmuramyl-tripeptide synthetase [Erysipelotrichaceae bacterium]|nr:UDP-N-acetylmuramyl-tripeptide synthetase [Erysipelotrichaceae bacterium]